MAETSINDPSENVIRLIEMTMKSFDSALKNSDNLNKAEIRRIDERSMAETDRINALRAVDVKAVELANDKTIKQAEVLARQLAENAEVLRKLVDQTAMNLATQLQAILTQQNERFSALEKANYENMGGIKGSQMTKSGIIAAIAVTGTIIGIVVSLINAFVK